MCPWFTPAQSPLHRCNTIHLTPHYKIFLIHQVLHLHLEVSSLQQFVSLSEFTNSCENYERAKLGQNKLWLKKSCSVHHGRLPGGACNFGTVVSSCALLWWSEWVCYTILKTMDRYCSYDTWIQPSWSVSYCLNTSVNLCSTIQHWMKSSNATCPFLWRSNFSISVP